MRIVFRASGAARAVELTIAGPARIVDLADEHRAPVAFGCRMASCGTCRVDVIAGADLLDAPGPDELLVLEIFGDDPARRRLACQARVESTDGLIELRAVEGA